MSDLTDLKFFIGGILRPLIREAVADALQCHQPPTPAASSLNTAPVLSANQVKEMTGWPNGTFYAKVAQMPEGVVIRGKSKRLLFHRENFMQWLQTPVQP